MSPSAHWCHHWIPSNEKPHRFVLSVLPRAIELVALTNQVNRINTSGFQLFGLRVRASAPNCSSLARCTQCGLLGHSGQSCTQYRGVACRVVMREPASYRFMTDLKKATNAPRAYLGQDLSERSPHRLITLLFDDLISDSTAAQLMEIGSRGLTDSVLPIRDLVADVRMVNVRDRLQECKRCGSMVRPHQCQLHEPGRPIAARRPNASSPLQRAVAQSERAAAVAASSNVCKTWRWKKSCPRLDSNRRCNWQHPADHTVSKRQICYDFRDTGHCARGGGCTFSDSHVPVQAPPAVDAPAPSPAASAAASHQLAPAAAAAAAAAAPAPALASEAPAEAPFTQVPPRRRGRQPGASPASAAAASSTHAAAAAPVSASHKKRKVATAELRTPVVTPERGAVEAKSVSAAASSPSDIRGWADECDLEEGELQAVAPPRSASPASGSIAMSSLSSLPSPVKSAAAAPTPKHVQRKPRVAKAAAATSSDSSSCASAQRSLSLRAPAFRPSSPTAAASSSLVMRCSSESDQASSNASNHQY